MLNLNPEMLLMVGVADDCISKTLEVPIKASLSSCAAEVLHHNGLLGVP